MVLCTYLKWQSCSPFSDPYLYVWLNTRPTFANKLNLWLSQHFQHKPLSIMVAAVTWLHVFHADTLPSSTEIVKEVFMYAGYILKLNENKEKYTFDPILMGLLQHSFLCPSGSDVMITVTRLNCLLFNLAEFVLLRYSCTAHWSRSFAYVLVCAVKHTILAVQILLSFQWCGVCFVYFFFFTKKTAVVCCSFKGSHLCSKNKWHTHSCVAKWPREDAFPWSMCMCKWWGPELVLCPSVHLCMVSREHVATVLVLFTVMGMEGCGSQCCLGIVVYGGLFYF